MAGLGDRFLKAGFPLPKPLIDIFGQPMIAHAIKSMGAPADAKQIFITRNYEDKSWNDLLDSVIKAFVPDAIIVKIDYVTNGSATTVTLAQPYLDMDSPMIVSDCDRIFASDWNFKSWMDFITTNNLDFCPITYWANTPNNSYVLTNYSGYIIEVAEKKVISNKSCNGVHYWRKAQLFFDSYEGMCCDSKKVNNEYYVTPSLQYLINNGDKGKPYEIENGVHIPVGTPYDLYKFINFFGYPE